MVYFLGLGLALPQTMAAALTPFPDHAGAASSLMGVIQMGAAAILGSTMGALLDGSAVPMVAATAACGVAALAVRLAAGRLRLG